MAVFRVAKTQDYVTMSNRDFKNKGISLKAKGLLSQMLSLPDGWDYTLKGLAHINKESIDAIRTAIWELENAGYIKRQQPQDFFILLTFIKRSKLCYAVTILLAF